MQRALMQGIMQRALMRCWKNLALNRIMVEMWMWLGYGTVKLLCFHCMRRNVWCAVRAGWDNLGVCVDNLS